MVEVKRRILIVDAHPVTRRGLRAVLEESMPGLILGEAGSYTEMLALLSDSWDLISLDLQLPDRGVLDLLIGLRRQAKASRVFVFTALSEDSQVVDALNSGVRGFVHKSAPTEELSRAVGAVLEGGVYLDAERSRLMAGLPDEAPHQKLSRRELEVFLLLARGRAIKEVAEELGLSHKTVSTYLSRIRDKTGLVSLVDIARYALRRQLVT